MLSPPRRERVVSAILDVVLAVLGWAALMALFFVGAVFHE